MKKVLLRAAACLLLLASLLLAACSSSEKTLLSYSEDGIRVTLSLNTYKLLQSRQKGVFASAYDVNDAAFWDQIDKWNGKDTETLDEYWCANILDFCRNDVYALWLFEKYGLSLDGDTVAAIDEHLDDLVKDAGSKNALNAILANYGVNYGMLRDVYLMEAKLETLKAHVSGLLGDSIKADYLKQNYVHFKQITLPLFHFVYENDQNGVPQKKLNTEGRYVTEEMNEEEQAARRKLATDLLASLQNVSDEVFEEKITKYNTDFDLGEEIYTDGYYIKKNATESEYLIKVIETLNGMKAGDVALVESGNACFLIRKYDMTDGAWKMDANYDWLEDFDANVANDFLLEQSAKCYDKITVDEAVFATAPTMKECGVNDYIY